MLAKCARRDDDSNSESSSSLVHRLEELTQLSPAMSASAAGQGEPVVDHRVLAGSSLISTFRMASGWCSPASPTKVYERSNPRGPSTFISQLSFARDPTIDSRHSPATSLSTCSTPARISPSSRVTRILHLDRHCHVLRIVQ